ncbi:MAG: hypothetical protein ACP5IK_01035 [Candidatus Micrarchaeia archaeon]
MDSYESWARNFKATIDEVLALYEPQNANLEVIISNLNAEFWGKFKRPEDLEGFSDDLFFEKIAQLALNSAEKTTGKDAKEIANSCYELGLKKNKDYGADNILKFGTMGLIVRIGDKINRLNNLMKNGTAAVAEEKLVDTIEDIFNYAVYGIMLSRGKWF